MYVVWYLLGGTYAPYASPDGVADTVSKPKFLVHGELAIVSLISDNDWRNAYG
jgi:hypothetical protein